MKEILLTSSVLILALLVLRRLFRKTISRRLQYALWGLVLVRLLVPVQLPAVEHNVLTAAEPVRQTVSVQLEDRKLYVLPTEQVTLPAPEERAPELQPGYEMPIQSTGIMVVDDGGDTATVYTGWITAEEVLRLVWYGGMILMAAWFLLANLRFYRKLRQNRTPYAVEGCRYPVYLVDCLPSPCLFGLLRPAIYLTPAAVASDDTLRHVLAHEMTHARHGDPIWSLLRCVCLVVYWFDPLVWAAAIASRQDCELACDEGALKKLGEAERIPYGQTLLRLIPVAKHPGSPMLSATTMSAGKKELKERITRIAENRRTVGVALLAVLTAAALVCVITFTAAKPHGEPLTYEELNRYSDLFSTIRYNFRGRQFLTSTYEKPEDINVYQLLYNTPPFEGDYDMEGPQSGPRQLVVDTYFDGVDPGIGLVMTTGDEIDQILQPFTGLTLSEIDPRIMENFYYAEGYDTYYYFHTDSVDLSYVRFYAGERLDDEVTLYYRAEPFKLADTMGSDMEVWARVTIRPAEDFDETGDFTIRSNQLCDRPDDLLGEMRLLTGEELTYFNSDDFQATYGAFLYPLFAAPRNIDLLSLLYHSTALHETPDAAETEEARAVVGPYDTLVKLSTAAINDYLMEYTGLTLAETAQDGLESFVYLADYDAYYLTVEEPALRDITFAGGTREGDIIRLYFEDFYYGGRNVECFTLLDRGDGQYWVVAHQLTDDVAISTVYPEEDPQLTLPLKDLAPTEPLEMELTHRSADDCVQRINGLRAESSLDGPSYAICSYISTDGNFYVAVIQDGPNGLLEGEPNIFFTVPQVGLYNDADTVTLDSFYEVLGFYDCFTIRYADYITGSPEQGGVVGDVTDYYVITEDGIPYRIARAYGECQHIDLDGDGIVELCAVSGASGQVFFRRDDGLNDEIYEADIKALLAEAWPELLYWDYGRWDPNYRCIIVTGTVKMPGWGDGSASFTRYIYLNEDSLLVYKPTEKTTVDHVVDTPNAPVNVLAAAKTVALEDYQAKKDSESFKAAGFDDWRVESLIYADTYDYPGGYIVVYNMNYEFHAQEPQNVMLTGGSYITEDGWCMIGYPYWTYLFFLQKDNEWTFLETRTFKEESPGTELFDIEVDVMATELGLHSMTYFTAGQLIEQLYWDGGIDFPTQLSQLDDAAQRDICLRLREAQNLGGKVYQDIFIWAVETMNRQRQYYDAAQEAAFQNFERYAVRSGEAFAAVSDLLDALIGDSITMELTDEDGLSKSFHINIADDDHPARLTARIAAFADNFLWTKTEPVDPADLPQSQLTLTSEDGTRTLTVWEDASQVYFTVNEQTYAFLAADEYNVHNLLQPFNYFRAWFDDVENASLFAEHSAMLDDLFAKEAHMTREQITTFWLDEMGKAAVDQITSGSRYACTETAVSDVTVSDTPLSAAMDREDQLAGAEHFYFTCRWTFVPEIGWAEEWVWHESGCDQVINTESYSVAGTYAASWSGVIAKVNGRWCCYGLDPVTQV